MTRASAGDLKLEVKPQDSNRAWNRDQAKAFVTWFDANGATIPDLALDRLKPLRDFLSVHPDVRTYTRSESVMLLRAMGIIPSSERRKSGRPLASLPRETSCGEADERTKWEQAHERSVRLGDWHRDLNERHEQRAVRLEEKLAKMSAQPRPIDAPSDGPEALAVEEFEDISVEDIELTEQQKADNRARTLEFVAHLELGHGGDPALEPTNETMMPGGAVVNDEESVTIEAELPPQLADAKVIRTLYAPRTRYDFAMTVTRLDLDVEKKIIVTSDGERRVVSASTAEYGPPRYSVTWGALATLAVTVCQFAMPLNRLATMISTSTKRFTAAGLSRMLHYVAERLLPIYLELAQQISNASVLAGDDTTTRVLEVDAYYPPPNATNTPRMRPPPSQKPPWADYAHPSAAHRSLHRCHQAREARLKRRADGDRRAKHTDEEDPTLGMLIGTKLAFESPRVDGDGPKRQLNTTVVTGRSVASDPRSLIVFYRSHFGAFGNLLESLFKWRNPNARDVVIQADLSTTNPVKSAELHSRFNIRMIGCSAHARRTFSMYEHDDPVNCPHMLHLFKGLAIHEHCLDAHGRNRANVLAVRQSESRELWDSIKKIAERMQLKWSPKTKLGVAARYVSNHFDALTAYLDDPTLEPTNNLRERLLRTEQLIENSSMFRVTLEGRFVFDIVRTVLQTAVAAGVPVHEYIESVLRANPDEVSQHPERFTPRAWGVRRAAEAEESE